MSTINHNKVALGFLIDRSASMETMDTSRTAHSINRFIKDQIATEKEIIVYGATFNSRYELFADGISAQDVNITEKDIMPDGTTALYDGIGNIISDVEERLLRMDERPGKIIIIILTDGEENSSKFTDRAAVNDMIENQKMIHNWEFVFLAANQDAIMSGGSVGINRDSSCTYDYSPAGMTNVLRTLSSAVTRTLSGDSENIIFTDEDRTINRPVDNIYMSI